MRGRRSSRIGGIVGEASGRMPEALKAPKIPETDPLAVGGANQTGERVILLVEDSTDDELLALRALGRDGVPGRVVVARDGVEALEYLFCTGCYADRDESASPDLVLLDLKLPRVDGLEVLKRLRSDDRTRLLPVVVLTSSREQRDVLASYGLGANSYVTKPVDFEQFTRTIAQLKLYWLVLNETPPN